METVTIRTRQGSLREFRESEITELERSLTGDILTPESDGYDEARSVWNGMIDRRPGLVVQCKTKEDVGKTVKFAGKNDLVLAVKGAGHNIAGSGVCDGGLVIDFAQMRSVAVDPDAKTARVEPGCTLGELDEATQAFGLAVPVGINSITGIAGLTLGGGLGWLARKHGMTVDSLLSAEVVKSDGAVVTASATDNPDLFWAIRGGGGNFGIVTSFHFRAYPIGPEVLAGLIVHPMDGAATLLREYRELVDQAPDELSAWVVLRKAPPLPFLPEEWHGKPVVIFAICYAGDMAEGEKAVQPLRSLGQPIADVVGPHPYIGWQQAFDPLLTEGARNYWKSHDFKGLSDEILDTILSHVGGLPSDETEVFLGYLAGAVNRVRTEETAYPHRDIDFFMNVHARWREPGDDDACIAWARGLFDAVAPFATGGVYVNFMPVDEKDRTRAAYGPNFQRLSELKARFDPENLFCTNQNIPPAK